MDIAMSSLPAWARLSIITAGVLFSPVFAVLMTLVVAILLGLLMEVRVPAPFALVIAGAMDGSYWRTGKEVIPVRPTLMAESSSQATKAG